MSVVDRISISQRGGRGSYGNSNSIDRSTKIGTNHAYRTASRRLSLGKTRIRLRLRRLHRGRAASGRLQASATFERSEAALVKEPPADDKEHAEDQKPDVPQKRCAEIVAHVMNAEYLVVDYSSTTLKMPHPASTSAK